MPAYSLAVHALLEDHTDTLEHCFAGLAVSQHTCGHCHYCAGMLLCPHDEQQQEWQRCELETSELKGAGETAGCSGKLHFTCKCVSPAALSRSARSSDGRLQGTAKWRERQGEAEQRAQGVGWAVCVWGGVGGWGGGGNATPHTVAPWQPLPEPAVQPKQWLSTAMRWPAR